MSQIVILFCIKKSPTSYRGGWLGVSWGREVFLSLMEWMLPVDRRDHGIKFFSTPEEAFLYIKENYPEDLWCMNVYRAVETSRGITFMHVPWSE